MAITGITGLGRMDGAHGPGGSRSALGGSGFADELNKLRGPEPNGAHHPPSAPEGEPQDKPQCDHAAERGSIPNRDTVYAGHLTATIRREGGYVVKVSDGSKERDLRPGDTVTARTGDGRSYYAMTFYENEKGEYKLKVLGPNHDEDQFKAEWGNAISGVRFGDREHIKNHGFPSCDPPPPRPRR
jgi:hypothetical protein